MVLTENLHVKPESNMVSGTLPMSCISNGEPENNAHKKSYQIQHHGLKRKHGGTCGSPSYDDADVGELMQRILSNAADNADSNMQPDVVSKKAKQQKDMTLQDIYNNQGLFEDDDDEDTDWEPVQKNVEIKKWFCTNCTMVNFGDDVHCDICGEHKESGIVRRGFFASPFSQDSGVIEVESKVQDYCSQTSFSKSSTALGFDERMLLHSEVEMKPCPHPERPDRLRAIAASLSAAGIFPGRCNPISAREITLEELQRVHSLEHIEAVELKSIHSCCFTADTYANEHSACAARLAAGLCADLASEIFSERATNGFALVRPPGHHAGVRQAMGFCLHNNAAVAALAAQAAGAKKVLILDWDVHHGNGTQEIFEHNKSVLYISLHRHEGGKFYPGTGAANEVGTKDGEGYCVNIPWSRGGVGDGDYLFAFQHIVVPIASEFAPDFTIISAGFDAARGDPLGCCDVTPAGYARMTHILNTLSDGKLLVILEGGYNLRSISTSAVEVIKVLLGESSVCQVVNSLPSKAGLRTVLEVLKIQMKFWPTLESSFTELQSQWGMYLLQNPKKQPKKRERLEAPRWWKWGRKMLLYRFLNKCHVKSRGC
ncbi:Hist_deacetyl domain-containing protein [Cephalotus follicularis]|uniref:histone deacetylase n=1 Tax=Cephalotus follicularis TaxID=3775 RepID=A0A1Q3BHS0_CEPFO|nr:Hist_deacetyl domain-containing protein [Cephalotus follicularis]